MEKLIFSAAMIFATSSAFAGDNSAMLQDKQEVVVVANNGQYTKSLNGRFAYSLKEKYVTSNVVTQLNLTTGMEREIVAGNFVAVIRAGRYAGYLLVDQHRYHDKGGSYECVSVIRPDGKNMFPATDNKAILDTNILILIASWPDKEAAGCVGQ